MKELRDKTKEKKNGRKYNLEERSDKTKRKRNRTTVKKERRFVDEIFSHFRKNIASKYTDRNSHACVIIMHCLVSKKS
jgi:hypothetical protein